MPTPAGDADEAREWRELADLLIPLSKSLCTDVGNETTSLAVQIHGGMGYVEETGIAQHYRDARIAAIYEGTNGIQAADLVGRKLAMRGGGVIADLLDEFDAAGEGTRRDRRSGALRPAARRSDRHDAGRHRAPHRDRALRHPFAARRVGAVPAPARHHGVRRAVAKSAIAASTTAVDDADFDADFLAAKVTSAKFFGEQILPTTAGLLAAVTSPADDLYALSADQLL